ncbi:sacsin N-terminal ATP-binding-like domain-containing protein [Marinobacter sp.]|uniref:sacsin N-terminal ATP-binding-like domain-containing protein n=1 Tax=Marinobacter sp. TaxID=50741 RepID=UPI003A8EA14C
MNPIRKVKEYNQDLARTLKKHTGIRKIVEELYPDSAHFIYELLQNAEDTGATKTKFALSREALVFEHNGRPFQKQDLYAITDIGEGTKTDDEDKIGRFGVGFKAVFAYTETPRIWSPTFSFQITELVLPEELAADSTIGQNTRFEFPFNNPKMSPADAYSEISSGLNQIASTTLLFLSNIRSITWVVERGSESEVQRLEHSDHHVETRKINGGRVKQNSYFLRFTQPVIGLERQNIAIAYPLDLQPGTENYVNSKPLSKQFQIAPASPGQVFVFFAAEKEFSGLRFHLHAPFVPELSRASIKETPANEPLYDQLAELVVGSLFTIKEHGLLNTDFLAVLPNPKDNVASRYSVIFDSIIEAMNEQPLTPTYAKNHAAAKSLLQAKAALKSLLSPEDLKFLLPDHQAPLGWAVGAQQKNSDIDRFLSGLDIQDFDIEQFVGVLESGLDKMSTFDPAICEFKVDPAFTVWLEHKPLEWHQKLYALLYRELEPEDELDRVAGLCLARISTGEYLVGDEAYFPTDSITDDPLLPRVAIETYTSGKNKKEQESARQLLEAIGVREVGEAEQVRVILEQRYSEEADLPDPLTHEADLKRFVALVEEEPSCAELFKDYWIFERKDGKWGQPEQTYLDSPFLYTGLSGYYDAFGDNSKREALASRYLNLGLSKKRVADFAAHVGACTELEISEKSCRSNPNFSYLRAVPGERHTSPMDRDYVIEGLDRLLVAPNLELAHLIWNMALKSFKNQHLHATYRKNQANGPRFADSQIVHQLRNGNWVPQSNGSFVRPSEAVSTLLPEGFSFDPGWNWIKAIRFGEDAAKQVQNTERKREVARVLGIEDEDALNDATWFAKLSPAERQYFKEAHERQLTDELPEQKPSNPERRAARTLDQARDAPERVMEMRARSVSVSRDMVKKDTKPYLRHQYTNSDGVMICQVCKQALPFKLGDGSFYFEAVQFLPELRKQHYQNYLSLCPNHAAMFEYVNGASDLLKDMVLGLEDNELELVLADENVTAYFTKTHIADLHAIIAANDKQD